MFCENCGCKLNDDDVFCASCGARVIKNPINPTEQIHINNQVAPVKNNNGLIIAIAIFSAVLLVLAGVLLFMLSGSDDNGETREKDTISQIDKDDDISDDSNKKKEKELEDKKAKLKEQLKKSIHKIDDGTVANIVASDSISTRYGIYVKNLSNGYTYEYNGDDIYNASAMCQVVILDTLFKECVDHNININNAGMNFCYLPNGKMAPGSDSQDGQYFTIRQFAEAVAEYGDNNRTNQLVDYIGSINGDANGFNVINDTLRKNGHEKTLISRKIYTYQQQHLIDESAPINRTTPSEIAEIYYDFIYNKSIDDPEYLKNICRSIDVNGQPIGFKKFISPEYSVYNVNAFNTQSSNNVAIISNGKTDVLVSILSETPENTADSKSGDKRDAVIDRLIDYIVQVQFQ